MTRNLIIVLGDQLDGKSAVFDDFDVHQDAVWMAEIRSEAEHVWSHKARIVMFLAAMRHFRKSLERSGVTVEFRELDAPDNRGSFAIELESTIKRLKPEKLVMVQPGEWRVQQDLTETAGRLGIDLEIRQDRHFLCSLDEFRAYAAGRKQLRLEFFYREMRQKHDVLMENSKPVGGKWNFDSSNRKSFPKEGPDKIPLPKRFRPDSITQDVINLVQRQFADHPGSLERFDWPVTKRQAQQALDDFVQNRLSRFGDFQDAMWTGEAFLYHSRLSAALNLKLLDPMDVIRTAETAWRSGLAPLNAVEGFVRQILGWREYVRGVYWLFMPEYLERNHLKATLPLPDFYWTGETEMNCLRSTIRQTLEYGYAHHIQRLMVTGLYALLSGVDPKAVHAWYLAMYVDAVEWVELPNTLGMSQYADGGVMASKPYVASGKYIQRMSNYCDGCRFDPAKATGENACPFTTLYWDFLHRHREKLKGNNRMLMQIRNLDRKSGEEMDAIRRQAATLRAEDAG